LRGQHYTILTKVVDKIIRTHILQLHNKLFNAQYAFKKVNSFLFLSFPLHHLMFFSNLHIKHQTKPNVHLMINYITKDNEKYKNNVMKTKIQNVFFGHKKKLSVQLIL